MRKTYYLSKEELEQLNYGETIVLQSKILNIADKYYTEILQIKLEEDIEDEH